MIATMSLLAALALAGVAATVVDWARDGYRRARPRT
ncbi:hypothetical protein QFZ29_003107 [Agromyces albus]|nr:hypothetical protein [Agromyces albus]